MTGIEIGAGMYFLLGAGVGLGELFRAPPWVDATEEIVFALFLVVAWPLFMYRLSVVNRGWARMSGKSALDDWTGGEWEWTKDASARGVDDSDKEGV
jgi:hypothetical protein